MCSGTQRVQIEEVWKELLVGSSALVEPVIAFLVINLGRNLGSEQHLNLTRLIVMALTGTAHRSAIFGFLAQHLLSFPSSPMEPVAFVSQWLSRPKKVADGSIAKCAQHSGFLPEERLNIAQAALSLWVDLVFSFEPEFQGYLPLFMVNALLLHPQVGYGFFRNLLQGFSVSSEALQSPALALHRALDKYDQVPIAEEEVTTPLFDLIRQATDASVLSLGADLCLEWGLQHPDTPLSVKAYSLYGALTQGGRLQDLPKLVLLLFGALSGGESTRVFTLVKLLIGILKNNPQDRELEELLCRLGAVLLNTSLRSQYTCALDMLFSLREELLLGYLRSHRRDYASHVLPLLVLGMTHKDTDGKALALVEILAKPASATRSLPLEALLLVLAVSTSYEIPQAVQKLRGFGEKEGIEELVRAVQASDDSDPSDRSMKDASAFLSNRIAPALLQLFPAREHFDFAIDFLLVSLVCGEISQYKYPLFCLLQSLLIHYAHFPLRTDQRRYLTDVSIYYAQSTSFRALAESAQSLLPCVATLTGEGCEMPLALFALLRPPQGNQPTFPSDKLLFPGDERPTFFLNLLHSLSLFLRLILQVSVEESAPQYRLLKEIFVDIEESHFPALDGPLSLDSVDVVKVKDSPHRKSARLSRALKNFEEHPDFDPTLASSPLTLEGRGSPAKPLPPVPPPASSRPVPSKPPPVPPSSSSSSSSSSALLRPK